ncbi:Gluconate 2-dehydrogenase gamma chain (plasmid) [Neorhizobium galegae bv. officinalis bv. officinalis str. HAMBI 1141]|uniref:Gluconate 2-dehydrogenase gamma chain n=1 Tax=Neorhizobium galegae bv. officinalis bv. officinalis str. HAMBI 1141 TaxID=1028801 RepID=A0A068TF14_NEOGA|nr:gluconate 2-dehydrogenase subunit 3 family protein [Neorhizobium galegae]CDN56998.1 Gluconate 2-dehydrogenase gamma chain [Neorhizobium galegae bv. officinalis bv. officinalis str. HAMBI 1141]
METHCLKRPTRRQFLSSVAFTILAGGAAPVMARSISGSLPWEARSADPPVQVKPGGWLFFTLEEAQTMEAVADRLVPADDLSLGGKDAGCVLYLDRQLVGSYGTSSRLYTKGPFMPGLPTQGYQASDTPAQRYRSGIAALNAFTRETKGGKRFAELAPADQDAVLKDLEAGKITLPNKVDAKSFFNLMLANVMEGFFADPIYGGNKDMASWKMLGFPGARYDYRDHVSKHNQPYPLPPVSIAGSTEWMTR